MEPTFSIVDHAPKVFVIGMSVPRWEGMRDYASYREVPIMDGFDVKSPEHLIAWGGKVCYDSFHNPRNASLDNYIGESILAHDHGSVLEHATINFAVASLPRSTQLELVRHRVGVAYSFRSTRFTDSWLEFVVPPLLREPENSDQRDEFVSSCQYAYEDYCSLINTISTQETDKTLRRKRIKEAARSVLPNALASDGEVTMNGRALRHIVEMRTNPHADESIREFAYALWETSMRYMPSTLGYDATITPVNGGVPQVQFGEQ